MWWVADPRLALRSGLGRVLTGAIVVVALALLMYQSATVRDGPTSGMRVLERAEFTIDGGAPREVALPHTWARDGVGNGGRGRYRIRFRLDAAPDAPWGLQAARLSSRHEVRLNGHWVHGETLQRPADRRGVPVPTWIDLAPGMLRAGENLLEVEVAFDYRAGQSSLRLGPESALWPAHVRDQVLHQTVPRSLNLFGAGLALFIVSIWWRRRSERTLGLFAGLMALLSVRNVAYSGTGTLGHTAATDMFFYLANVASALLLAGFALAWSGREWRPFRRIMAVGGVLLAAAAVVSLPFDGVQRLRIVTYPLLLASLVPSLVLMVLGIGREAGATRVALLVGVVLLCLAPVHDYFHIRGLTPVTDVYWMPFVVPVTLVVFAWTLLDRFVAALGAVEEQAAELERRVALRTRELAEANAAKTRFLAGASHDLRQPVVSVSLLTGLLREQPLGAAARLLADRIADSVAALNALLKGLLDLSRFDAGAVTPRRGVVALRPLLDTALADERELARRKGLALRVRAGDLRVSTDPLLAEQIVRNLVGNAVRYTDRGGVLVAARLRRPDRVLLQVWDTGRGIPEAARGSVFDEFVQLERPAGEAPGGLGLGLALVRRATNLLGLPLRLRSRVGRGSCFEVELPLAGPEAPPAAAPVGPPPEPIVAPLAGRRIWVVDDEPDVREALRLRLEAWGADVQAFDGLATLGAALQSSSPAPDQLLTDQHLRDGTGLQAAARVRERWPGLPVLVVTGDTAPGDVALLLRSGVPTLHKPFAADALLVALRELVPPAAAA
jgi:signal transduction histidine kinase/CheY-like chemotaxis protein